MSPSSSTFTAEELATLDLYALLGAEVGPSSTVKELRQAYRKRALVVHPDKNPNDPEAATLFDQLNRAIAHLSEETFRAEYDRVRVAQRERQERVAQEDDRMRAMREALERRERAAQDAHAQRRQVASEEHIRRENREYIAHLLQQGAFRTTSNIGTSNVGTSTSRSTSRSSTHAHASSPSSTLSSSSSSSSLPSTIEHPRHGPMYEAHTLERMSRFAASRAAAAGAPQS